MLTPCEVVFKGFLPAIKSSIARELAGRGFTQVEIASQLGLTQAAVSKYLSGAYSDQIRQLAGNAVIRDSVRKMAEEIEKEKMTRARMAKEVCATCEKFLGDKWDCRVSKFATDKAYEPILEAMLEKSEPAEE
ncbi:DUF2703 domain-containing protein [Candidatus Micrarchaeota archaeon]|nr:DUF2703 domain-containing protein [Candidatus Micrarchaeota archaeon]